LKYKNKTLKNPDIAKYRDFIKIVTYQL
jgi:hypothetical protein